MADIDAETVFNWATGTLATAGVLFFLFNVESGLSPVSVGLLVAAFVLGIVALTQRTDDAELRTVGYAVAVVSGVGLFVKLANTFDAGSAVVTVGLLALAAALFGLRTRLDETGGLVDDRRATLLFGAVAALALLVVVGDVATGGLQYELRTAGEIQVPETREAEVEVGVLVATNPTPLPERVEPPRYRACAAGDWSEYREGGEGGEPPEEVRLHLDVEGGYDDHVAGFGERRYPVRLHIGARNVTGAEFAVRVRERCPDDESGAAYVAVFPAEGPRGDPV